MINIPILIVANIVVWKIVRDQVISDEKKLRKSQKEDTPIPTVPEEPYVDWIRYYKDRTFEDYLWEEGIINPSDRPIPVDGYLLEVGNPKDLETFMKIKNKAYLEGQFHGKPLEDGGQEELEDIWYLLMGCSEYGAEQMREQGIRPWEVANLITL